MDNVGYSLTVVVFTYEVLARYVLSCVFDFK